MTEEQNKDKMKMRQSETPANPPGRRTRQKTATKARIVESALDLLSRQEYGATTIEQVTEAADVGKGTYFNYFSSKEHLLYEVAKEQMETIRISVEKALVKQENTKKVFHDLFFELTKLFTESPILARNLLLANLGNDSARELLGVNVAERVEWLAKLVEQGQKLGCIRKDITPTIAAYWYLDVYFGNLLYWAFEPPARKKDWLQFSFEQFWISVAADSSKATRSGHSIRARRSSAKR